MYAMDSRAPQAPDRSVFAHVAPFGIFMGFLILVGATDRLALDLGLGKLSPLFLNSAFVLYPIQTIVCAAALWIYRREYFFTPHSFLWGLVAGVAVLAIWLAPQVIFGQPPRTEGFDPTRFEPGSSAYWFTVVMRFVRLAVVVPFVEEIFWRGFLMRYLIDSQGFAKVAFGTYKPISFFGVALLFTLVHSPDDYPAAFLAGCAYNGLAVYTRSLSACVFAHAVTNLLLGFYIMATKQWGFW